MLSKLGTGTLAPPSHASVSLYQMIDSVTE